MNEDKNWIVAIIKSCNNTFHFEAVDKLINLYHDKYGKGSLTMELLEVRKIQYEEIHNILS